MDFCVVLNFDIPKTGLICRISGYTGIWAINE